MNRSFAFLILSSLVGLAACSADSSVESSVVEPTEQSGEALSQAQLVGSYEFGGEGWLNALRLNKNGTYSAEQIVQCIKAPCEPIEESGQWHATSKSIYLSQGKVARRYSYVAKGMDLRLYEGGALYAHLVKSEPTSQPDSCAAVRCAAGTVCKTAKDGSAHCVSNEAPVGACAAVRCAAGTVCKPSKDGTAACVSTEAPVDACAAVRCAAGTVCKPSKDGSASCVPTADPCGGCAKGQSCQLCWGSNQCVPNGAQC